MAGFERALASLAGSPDRQLREKSTQVNGKLTATADGIWEAQEGPVSMWSTTEMYPGAPLFSFEVNAELPIAGTVWLLPSRDPESHTKLAPSRGFPVPDRQLKSPLRTHTAWTDGDVFEGLLETPRFIELAQALGPRESLRMDPGGVSFWELGRSGFRARNWLYGRWARKRSELTTELVAFFK
ncbi:MAG: hypothetical protein ACI9KE_005581 [Polyangiales bacterium]|jgi:hypothetical protein